MKDEIIMSIRKACKKLGIKIIYANSPHLDKMNNKFNIEPMIITYQT